MATQRSFSKAAKRLGKSPQAVTRAVAALEARIGTKLLNRTTRSVSLTNDGEQYLERSRRALAELDALEAPLDTQAELRGTIAVTASVLFGELHVAPIVGAFLDLHPRVDARLVLLDRVVSLAEEGIDVGVRIGPLPDSSLIARPVGRVRTVIVASPAYLERAGMPRVDNLAKHSIISFTGTKQLARNPRLVVNTARAAIDAALAGRGLARVLSYQVAALVEAKRLRTVLPALDPSALPVHLVSQSRQSVRPARLTTAFLDHATPLLRACLT